MRIRCNDYVIFRINYYADRDKSGNIDLDMHEVLLQHYDRAKTFNDFCFALVEKLTGKPKCLWVQEFIYETRDCVLEYIWEHHGIVSQDQTDGIKLLMVPKEQTKVIEWIKMNLKNPFTMPKKTDIRVFDHFLLTGKTFPSWKRDEAKEFKAKYYPTGFPK